ncbi:hypothetical protein [Amycolatopsis saalfeldensis]|uniref:hypothetical protein n=1 Tax=Amycolatopsis saalfeldensis TaxID=394193 RepID=UPI001C434051|nr:hypothetical protein [Amycolatopsis saalfeldensis]
MDELLSEAMAPVLRDLRSADVAPPRIEDRDWAGDPDSASVLMWGADGSGVGVYASRSASAPDRVAMVAEQVQDWAIEQLWGRATTNWPACPRHPETHPLRVSVRDGVAVWTCPAGGVAITPVGSV